MRNLNNPLSARTLLRFSMTVVKKLNNPQAATGAVEVFHARREEAQQPLGGHGGC
jgi:hypothetical protein